jgi:hypothetical protein
VTELRTTTGHSAFLFYLYVLNTWKVSCINGKNCAAIRSKMGITKEAACCRLTAGTACTLEPDIKLEFSACDI